MMDYLRRGSAPLSERVWAALDEAAAQAARHVLTGRRVATFDGPKGWEYTAARLGTMTPCATQEGTAIVCVPELVLLAEVRADFTLPWSAVEVFERGAPRLDTDAVENAAREVALAEDRLLFYGDPVGSGFLTSPKSPHLQISDWKQPQQVIADLVQAVEILDAHGIPGPYEAVMSSARYYTYRQATTAAGNPASRTVQEVLAAVHRSPVLRDGAAVFSTRGDDFVITVGGDLAAGYRWHDRESIHLFCAETLAAQTMTPEAVCILA
jgi:uncharacterized linocin/CFP29 family protein